MLYRLVRAMAVVGAIAPPDFGRSFNPISTKGNRLCPPNYYWHTQIFRPSDGPAMYVFLGTARVAVKNTSVKDKNKDLLEFTSYSPAFHT